MAPVAAIAAVLVSRYVPTSRDEHAPRIDRGGFALSAAAIGLLVYTIIEAPNYGWGSTRTLGGFALTAIVLIAFVAWERRSDAPMLDVNLFRNPRFTAASGSVAISFFALSGFIFLVTQYFQFLKTYGPLSTGVRLLPVASAVAVSSVLGTKLAVRFGTKLVVTSGLVLMSGFYVWVSTGSASTGYGTIAVQMLVLGTGMGLTSAPATEAIMGVVPAAKAGVGSAVNDTTRLLGGTLGVAVIGSVFASLYASRLTAALPAGLPAAVTRSAHASVGAALGVASSLRAGGHTAAGAAVHDAATAAFFYGFSRGQPRRRRRRRGGRARRARVVAGAARGPGSRRRRGGPAGRGHRRRHTGGDASRVACGPWTLNMPASCSSENEPGSKRRWPRSGEQGPLEGDDRLEPGDRDSEDLYQDEFDEGRSEDLQRELEALERAEARLAEGTYGLSVESGEPIPDGRLEALPTAERTVEEQDRLGPA